MVNFENSFWKEYPGIEYHSVFNKMYKKDKSRNKANSSKIMWAIYLLVNPSSNLYNDPNKEETIKNTFLKNKSFKWSDYEQEVYAYKDIALSVAEKALQNWNELMTMRDKSLKDMYKKALEESDAGSLVNLDKMIANTAKLFQDYSKIKKDYEEEKTTKKGKSISSLSDSDEI
jgi:hypothetical protein